MGVLRHGQCGTGVLRVAVKEPGPAIARVQTRNPLMADRTVWAI